MKILIMAGGSGERFWPLSTKQKPKQLLHLFLGKSLIADTVDRVLEFCNIEDVFVATNTVQVEGIKKEIPNLPERNIIIEPAFRDTAAAIAYGATIIAREEKNPVIAVLASDHVIRNREDFTKSIKIAEKEAKQGSIVTLGINPDKPETGYGYIKVNEKQLNKPTKALAFMEKPNYETAYRYLESNEYVWNSGMFIFEYDTIMEELKKHTPNHYDNIQNIKKVINSKFGEELSNLVKPYFPNFEKISIDYAVMEKSNKIKCIPVDFGWNDVGSYNALEEIFDKLEDDHIVKNCEYTYIDSNNNIVISDEPKKHITTIGIDDSVIINTKNHILVCKKRDTRRLKELLKLLK